MHLADTFIQSDLQYIKAIHLLSVCVFPGNWTHNLCASNPMLYHWATGTQYTMTLKNVAQCDMHTVGEFSLSICDYTNRVFWDYFTLNPLPSSHCTIVKFIIFCIIHLSVAGQGKRCSLGGTDPDPICPLSAASAPFHLNLKLFGIYIYMF